MDVIKQLETLRTHGGEVRTTGLPDAVVLKFSERDPRLAEAVGDAVRQFNRLRDEYPDLLAMDEASQIATVQSDMVNFYSGDTVSPFVSLAARGPWVITLKGAVVHDNGGYGMNYKQFRCAHKSRNAAHDHRAQRYGNVRSPTSL